MKAALKYTGLRVKDLDESIRFYTRVLGLTVRSRETIAETGGTVVDLVDEDGRHPLELNHYAAGSPFDTPYTPGEGIDHLGFRVDDLDAAIAEATREGFPVVQEIRVGAKRWVYIQDPNGIWIELFA
ncbi:MAG TPA: VOC family protein [Thermoplasmata archaeon]|nr:VOC family protein [Thermoplasmata archaeon]